jgi:nucleotidyltransferase substrate binding protein (TIGR01987 family)
MSFMPPAIDLTSLHRAFAQLQETLAFWDAEPPASALKRHLRAAVIQSFEYTYELSLRMLRRVLIERALASDLVEDLSFNDLLRLGADAGLVRDPQAWRRWRAMRNITGHTYDDGKAAEVADAVRTGFVADVEALVNALQAALANHSST